MSDNPNQTDPNSAPEPDAFASFDPDAYLKQRGIGQSRTPPRADPSALPTPRGRRNLTRRAGDDDFMDDLSSAAGGVMPDDGLDAMGSTLQDAQPLMRAAVIGISCAAVGILVTLGLVSLILIVQLLTR